MREGIHVRWAPSWLQLLPSGVLQADPVLELNGEGLGLVDVGRVLGECGRNALDESDDLG